VRPGVHNPPQRCRMRRYRWPACRRRHNPTLSPEDVQSHFAEIRDPTMHTVPAGLADEMAELFSTITQE